MMIFFYLKSQYKPTKSEASLAPRCHSGVLMHATISCMEARLRSKAAGSSQIPPICDAEQSVRDTSVKHSVTVTQFSLCP